MIWDRAFGTFVAEERDEPARYGLVKNLTTFNPVRIATHEYVAIARDLVAPRLTVTQRLAYLFAPPGWSHDGTRHSTESLRAAEAERLQRAQLAQVPAGGTGGAQNLAMSA
jgi:hypothetical protein